MPPRTKQSSARRRAGARLLPTHEPLRDDPTVATSASGITKAEPSGGAGSGLTGALLWVSGRPERQ